jgi:hypothetical protein
MVGNALVGNIVANHSRNRLPGGSTRPHPVDCRVPKAMQAAPALAADLQTL